MIHGNSDTYICFIFVVQVVEILKGESKTAEVKQKTAGGRAVLLDACDVDNYNSTTYLKDLNRHMELVMDEWLMVFGFLFLFCVWSQGWVGVYIDGWGGWWALEERSCSWYRCGRKSCKACFNCVNMGLETYGYGILLVPFQMVLINMEYSLVSNFL